MDQSKEDEDGRELDNPRTFISFLKRPITPQYTTLPDAAPAGTPGKDENAAIPGFDEFRKYKRVNETRIITPYKPEERQAESKGEEGQVEPLIEVEDAERFLMEKIGNIPVESLSRLVATVSSYPNLGFLPMNRCHMDLVNDYRPYDYTICRYSEVDKTNYVTISASGLLEVYRGDADFMPLERLPTEYEIYCALQKIPFFASLHVWKAFVVWRKKIRRKKFMEAKVKIEEFFAQRIKAMQEMKNN